MLAGWWRSRCFSKVNLSSGILGWYEFNWVPNRAEDAKIRDNWTFPIYFCLSASFALTAALQLPVSWQATSGAWTHVGRSWDSFLQLQAPLSLRWNMVGPEVFVARKIILIWSPPAPKFHPIGNPWCLKSHQEHPEVKEFSVKWTSRAKTSEPLAILQKCFDSSNHLFVYLFIHLFIRWRVPINWVPILLTSLLKRCNCLLPVQMVSNSHTKKE